MNKKSKFKIRPNIELIAIESKKVLPRISVRVSSRIQRKERIKAFNEYFAKSSESEEYNSQKYLSLF